MAKGKMQVGGQDMPAEQPVEQPAEQAAMPAEAAPEAVTPEATAEMPAEMPAEAPAAEDDKSAPAWVKELRKTNRELKKENEALRAQLASRSSEEDSELTEPELEHFGYDPAEFKKAMIDYMAKKSQRDMEMADKQAQEKAQMDEWNGILDGYDKGKAGMGKEDFDEVENKVRDVLDATQQGIIMLASENSPLLIYTLGKDDAKLGDLAKIKDPTKFAVAVAKLDMALQGKKSQAKGTPDEKMDILKSGAMSPDEAMLNKLREEAGKSGDMTALIAYKRKMRSK